MWLYRWKRKCNGKAFKISTSATNFVKWVQSPCTESLSLWETLWLLRVCPLSQSCQVCLSSFVPVNFHHLLLPQWPFSFFTGSLVFLLLSEDFHLQICPSRGALNDDIFRWSLYPADMNVALHWRFLSLSQTAALLSPSKVLTSICTG